MPLTGTELALAVMDDDGWGCAITAMPAPRTVKYNTLYAVVGIIEATSAAGAVDILRARLDEAGFAPYEGTEDLVPAGYKLAFEMEGDA